MEEKYHRIADVSLNEAIDRCIKAYGIEGTEDTINRVYTHPNLTQLKRIFLNELYRRIR